MARPTAATPAPTAPKRKPFPVARTSLLHTIADTTNAPLPQNDPIPPARSTTEAAQPADDPAPPPLLSDHDARVRSILDDTPARFEVADNPEVGGSEAIHELPWIGAMAVEKYGRLINEAAKKHGVDADLMRAVLWAEHARGHKGGLNFLADLTGTADSLLPMNIKPDIWSSLVGAEPEALSDPKLNIEAAAILLKRIARRVESPTPAKIGSVWHFSGREKVSEFGAYIGRVYREKPWK